MKNGDISNLPAPSVGCNLGALIMEPPSQFLKRNMLAELLSSKHSLFKATVSEHARRFLNRFLTDGFNIMCFVEFPELYMPAKEFVLARDLPVQVFVCPDVDHFNLVTHVYPNLERVLWVNIDGNNKPIIEMDYMIESQDHTGWLLMYDAVKERRL